MQEYNKLLTTTAQFEGNGARYILDFKDNWPQYEDSKLVKDMTFEREINEVKIQSSKK